MYFDEYLETKYNFNHHLLFWANRLKWTEPQIFTSCQPASPEILLWFQADNMFCSVGCYYSYQCLLKSWSNWIPPCEEWKRNCAARECCPRLFPGHRRWWGIFTSRISISYRVCALTRLRIWVSPQWNSVLFVWPVLGWQCSALCHMAAVSPSHVFIKFT